MEVNINSTEKSALKNPKTIALLVKGVKMSVVIMFIIEVGNMGCFNDSELPRIFLEWGGLRKVLIKGAVCQESVSGARGVALFYMI